MIVYKTSHKNKALKHSLKCENQKGHRTLNVGKKKSEKNYKKALTGESKDDKIYLALKKVCVKQE